MPTSIGYDILAVLLPILIIMFVISIFIYIYFALAYQRIAKKTNTKYPWLAWIPVANLYLYSKIAKMHWWPMILIIGLFIPWFYIGSIMLVIFIVYMYIWQWKIFVRVNCPGWWALISIIPWIGQLIFLVLLGIAAWGRENIEPIKENKSSKPAQTQKIQRLNPRKPAKPQRAQRVDKLKRSLK